MEHIPDVPPGVDPAVPSPARLYDYFLGGSNHFPGDREAGEWLKAAVPDMADGMWANRGFHGRAAVWMAEHGIRQFIDLGSGLPLSYNTHEAVHRVDPGARVVYVDDDPMVIAYGRPFVTGDGTTVLVNANPRDPQSVLADRRLRKLIDTGEPTGVLITTFLHFMPDAEDPWSTVAAYINAQAPGSYLGLSHGTYDKIPPQRAQAGVDGYAKATEHVHLRSRADIERFFTGLELVVPYEGAPAAVTFAGLWGAEDIDAADSEGSRGIYCGVARRP